MSEYVSLVTRCFVFYFLIILYLRIMGKREVGELSVFDLVLYFLMTELLAISISNIDDSVFKTIVPVTVLAALQITLAWFLLKSKKMRDVVEGKPAIIIRNGVIQQKEMRKHRYTIDDLLFQIRSTDVGSVSEIEFALLENSGVLTVLKKDSCCLMFPFPFISDGQLLPKVLKQAGVSEAWLLEELRKQGYDDVRTIFLCLWEKDGLFVVKKEGS